MASYSIREISIVNQLDRARKDLNALKGSQFVSRSGLATKKTESTLITSESVNIAASGTLVREVVSLIVTFRADNQSSPFGRLSLEFYDMAGNPINTDSGVSVLYLNDIVTRVDDGILQWNMEVRSTGAGTIGLGKYRVKLVAYATDAGRLTWQKTSEAFGS